MSEACPGGWAAANPEEVHTMRRLAPLALVICLAGCSQASPSVSLISASPVNATVPTKFVIIFMENHSASDVIGNANMPYLNSFARQGVRFTNYHEGNS